MRERPAAGLPDVQVPARARILPIVGLIGAPLLIAAVIVTVFGGGIRHVAAFAAIATLPVAAWEFSLGAWLVVKGFRPCPITAEMTAAEPRPPTRRHRLTAKDTAGPAKGPATALPADSPRAGAGDQTLKTHRTRLTGRMANAPMMAQSPATAYSTP